MGVKKKSQNGKGTYARYQAENRFTKNKRAKLERHLKAFPNDEIAQAALKQVGNATPRQTPKRTSSRFGIAVDSVPVVGKGGKIKMTEVPRSINLLSGRLSHDGKIQQQFARMARAVQRVTQYTQKNGMQPVGDGLMDKVEYFKAAPTPITSSGTKKKTAQSKRRRSRKQKQSA